MSNIGKNLEPAKFGITPGQSLDPSPNTSPDQFGQVYDASQDNTSGNTPSALQSKLDHSSSDVDSSPQSQHHTLGTARTQSAYGDHIHDGVTSKKLGGRVMDPAGNNTIPALTLTGAKGGNVALTNLIALLKNFIDFNDTTT